MLGKQTGEVIKKTMCSSWQRAGQLIGGGYASRPVDRPRHDHTNTLSVFLFPTTASKFNVLATFNSTPNAAVGVGRKW